MTLRNEVRRKNNCKISIGVNSRKEVAIVSLASWGEGFSQSLCSNKRFARKFHSYDTFLLHTFVLVEKKKTFLHTFAMQNVLKSCFKYKIHFSASRSRNDLICEREKYYTLLETKM